MATAVATAVETGPKPLLDIVTPTPADIIIAQSVKPKHISQIAEVKLGLGPDDYELQGPSKAKVGRGARASEGLPMHVPVGAHAAIRSWLSHERRCHPCLQ